MYEALKSFSKVELNVTATPLERLDRLSSKLEIDLWVKRDDFLPFPLGGNKVRQLEYYLGPAGKMQADTILITGAIQSNFVRLCAAACRKLGWQPVVQLEQRVPKSDEVYNTSGNVLLNHLLGAEIHYFEEGDNEAAADANLDELARQYKAMGRKPYVIHLGVDHPPIGALGYAQAAAELSEQCNQSKISPDHIIVPSGSGLTHAGFLCGTKALNWDTQVHGICVRRNVELQMQRIVKRAEEIDELLGVRDNVSRTDINIWDDVLSPGYGQLNPAVDEAIHLAAAKEGLLVDPVYSGRTLAGLISLVRKEEIAKGATVIFLHTGGLAALFAYQKDLIK